MTKETVSALLDEVSKIKLAEGSKLLGNTFKLFGGVAGTGARAAGSAWGAARAGADAAAAKLEHGGGTVRKALGGAVRLAPFAGVAYGGHKILHSQPVENWRYKRQLRNMQQQGM